MAEYHYTTEELPPPSTEPDKDYAAWVESDWVLAWSKDDPIPMVACVQHWEDGTTRWVQRGRDGYTMDDVEIWKALPILEGHGPQ